MASLFTLIGLDVMQQTGTEGNKGNEGFQVKEPLKSGTPNARSSAFRRSPPFPFVPVNDTGSESAKISEVHDELNRLSFWFPR